MPKPTRKPKGEAAPLTELDKALKGIVGTDKAEVDAEAKKEQRRKGKGKRKKC